MTIDWLRFCALPAGSAPAPIGAADPMPSRRAPRPPESVAGGFLDDRRHVVGERMDASGSRALGLRIGSPRHRAEHQQSRSEGDRKLTHQSPPSLMINGGPKIEAPDTAAALSSSVRSLRFMSGRHRRPTGSNPVLAGCAPAARRAANPVKSGWAMTAKSNTGRPMDRRRVLRLRIQARRPRLLVLRARRERHGSERNYRHSKRNCEFSHQPVLLVFAGILR